MAVDLPDDIVPIGAAAPPGAPPSPPAEKPSLPDDIVPVGKAEEPTPPDLKDPATKAILQRQYGPIWDVFTAPRRAADALSAGFKEGWGEQPLGMNPKDIEWMQKHGLFRNDRDEGVAGVFRAFNEAVFFRGAQVLDAAVRSATSLYHGAQVAGQEVGLPRDVVGIPDAFMGSPHPLGIPGEVPKAAEAARAEEGALARGEPPVEAPPGETPAAPVEVVPTPKLPPVDYEPGAAGEPATLFFQGVRSPRVGGLEPGSPQRSEYWTNRLSMARAYAGPDGFIRVARWEAFPKEAKIRGIDARGTASSFRLGEGGEPGQVLQVPEISQLPASASDEAFTALKKPPLPLDEARDLGVVGPERPDIRDMPPEEAARTVAARQPEDVIRGPEPGGSDNPWQQRFDQFVGKLETTDDVKQLIQEAAKDNDAFPEARRGDLPLAHVESIAEAAGVAPSEIDPRGLGRTLKNDNEVRVAMQLMLQVTENVKEAARDVKADGSPESLIKLQESIMRRDLAVEQVVGLRAEWGRTGNVFKEFLRDVKDQQGLSDFLKTKGRTPADLHDIANAVDALDSGQAARFMNDLRTPSTWDKFIFYWVNALISGPFTHAKYIGANAAFAAYEAGLVTPIAGTIGAVRSLGKEAAERVYVGEAAARTWGLIAGTPDAIKAAVTAARQGIQVPLPGEVAKNINPVINMRPNPIGGTAGVIVGIPSRGAAGIHSFFNFLGYRAEIEAQAYRAAAKEGLSPLGGDGFWQRRGELAANPTPEMMDKAIENGYHLTFITEQGEAGKAIQNLTRAIPPLRLVFPFTHIPGNILKAGLEQTPAAFLDSNMRADLLGRNGAVARDTAHARLVAGGVISGMVANWAVNDNITGYGPTDPTERAMWLRTHEPYSVKVGGYWVSYNRFGPIGDLMGLVANLTEVGPKMKEGEYTEAAGQVLKATSHLVMDEVGMQGLANLIEAMEDPDRKGARFLANQTATALPYSSLLRQSASASDPYMREAKTFVDGVRNTIPFARQDLLPKRDWLGMPLANPGYAGGPTGGVLRTRAVNTDPVDLEVQQLHIKPGPPQDRIGGVKLSPEMYDRYQAMAGPLTRMALESMVNNPDWHSLPPYVREQAFRHVITGTRQSAAAAMQAGHPDLIRQGMQQRIDHITGASFTSRPKRAPQITPPSP